MNRRISGRKAFFAGSGFEKVFAAMCTARGMDCVVIPPGCRTVGKRIMRVFSPFDFVIGMNGRAAFVDCKSVDSGNFTYSSIVPHQLQAFKNLQKSGLGGYIIRINGKVYFGPWQALDAVKPKGHLELYDCQNLGSESCFDPRLIFGELSRSRT